MAAVNLLASSSRLGSKAGWVAHMCHELVSQQGNASARSLNLNQPGLISPLPHNRAPPTVGPNNINQCSMLILGRWQVTSFIFCFYQANSG